MEFLTQGLWWLIVASASLAYGLCCRWGSPLVGTSIGRVGRLAFVSLIAIGYLFTEWQGGLAITILSGLAGQFLPVVFTKFMTKPVGDPQTRVAPISHNSGPSGRREVLRDMIHHGISREKVRALIRNNELIALEDPESGVISLVRPEDADSIRNHQKKND